MPSQYAYKVRRKKDGKYSDGSTTPRWSAGGKLFTNLHAIKMHLRWFLKGPAETSDGGYIQSYGPPRNPDDYVIDTYELLQRHPRPTQEFI